MAIKSKSFEEVLVDDEFDDPGEFNSDEGVDGPDIGDLGTSVIETTLSEFVQAVLTIPDAEGRFAPFSFHGRRHMIPIYDTPARDILLMCGRQVEKCVGARTPILLPSGEVQEIRHCKVGQRVVTLKGEGVLGEGEVVWVSPERRKPCLKLTTRTGHQLVCAKTHPIRTWGAWTEAKDLVVGDKVASVRKLNAPDLYAASARPPFDEAQVFKILWTAIALGPCVHRDPGYQVVCRTTTIRRAVEESLFNLGYTEDADYRVYLRTPGSNPSFYLGVDCRSVLSVLDSTTAGATIPSWVFKSSAEEQRLFLRYLWACAGTVHVSLAGSISIRFMDQRHTLLDSLQRLLWRSGIPTSRRVQRVAGQEYGYLRVETSDGISRMNTILCEEQKYQHEPGQSRSPYDTFPDGLNRDLRLLLDDAQAPSLRQLKTKIDRAFTPDRLKALVGKLQGLKLHPHRLNAMQQHADTDLLWDNIVSIEPVGDVKCLDIQVSPGHSFVANGLVTHNSTYLGNRALALCALIPGYKVLYVSPSAQQTKTFSTDRLKLPVETSAVLKALSKGATQNVLEKEFNNGAKVVLRSAFLSADRVRGQAAYLLDLDELQDLISDHIPVIEPAISHAPKLYQSRCYSGTPKSMNNHIEERWSGLNREGRHRSTMGEWLVPCDRCGSKAKTAGGRFWQALGEKNIGKKGLICSRCGKLIQAQHPDAGWYHQHPEGEFEGYRIPQLMAAWIDWEKILHAYNTYPPQQFYNEVLGLSLDAADRPLTSSEINACCDPRISMTGAFRGTTYIHPEHFLPSVWSNPVFAGIDWGFGTSSYTILSLGTYLNGKFTVFYMKRFTGAEASDFQLQMNIIVEILTRFQVKICGTDFGFGAQQNDTLMRIFGPGRIQVYQHLARAKYKVEYDRKIHRWKLYRTLVMADHINAIKRKAVVFPRWEEFGGSFAEDFTNITAEYSETQRVVVYDHASNKTDDAFHSYLYLFLASQVAIKRPDILVPTVIGTPGQHPIFVSMDPIDQS